MPTRKFKKPLPVSKWTPLRLPNLVRWYDFYQQANTVQGNYILDYSKNKKHAAFLENKPTWIIGSGLVFNATYITIPEIPATVDRAILLCMRVDNINMFNMPFAGSGSTYTVGTIRFQQITRVVYVALPNNPSASYNPQITIPSNTNTWFTISANISDNSTLYKYRTCLYNRGTEAAYNASGPVAAISSIGNSTFPLYATIAGMAVCSSVLTIAQMQSWYDYYSARGIVFS
jgi:hypothetical protein